MHYDIAWHHLLQIKDILLGSMAAGRGFACWAEINIFFRKDRDAAFAVFKAAAGITFEKQN